MTEAAGELRLEHLLADALRPIEPPEDLASRVQATLGTIAEHAAAELSSWADELSRGSRRCATRATGSVRWPRWRSAVPRRARCWSREPAGGGDPTACATPPSVCCARSASRARTGSASAPAGA